MKASQLIRFTYAMSLAEMIAASELDWVDPLYTTVPIPIVGDGEVVMPIAQRLRHTVGLKPREAVSMLDEKGFRPAAPAEFLLYCANNKGKPRNSIVSVQEIDLPGDMYSKYMSLRDEMWGDGNRLHVVGRILTLPDYYQRNHQNTQYLVVPK